MDAAEAREVFLSRSPVVWKDLITQKEYEFPHIEAMILRFIKNKPTLQLEVLDEKGRVMIISPKQTRKKG